MCDVLIYHQNPSKIYQSLYNHSFAFIININHQKMALIYIIKNNGEIEKKNNNNNNMSNDGSNKNQQNFN